MALVHASCVVMEHTGVLIRGASGTGKSDLALRLIDAGAVLVADDYCEISAADGRLAATVPAAIAGKLEVRGFGIVALPHVPHATIGLIVDLRPAAEIERLPTAAFTELEGLRLPCLRLDSFAASAVAKVRLALRGGLPETLS